MTSTARTGRTGRTARVPAARGIDVHAAGLVHLYRAEDGADVVALRGIDLDIDPGERVALLGPSGSGKSTLLALMGGLLRPSAGRLVLDRRDLARTPERELARIRAGNVGTVLQGAGRNLLPYATALGNLGFARRAVSWRRRRALPSPNGLLQMLDLADAANRPAHHLSGGEQQRLALAVGIANAPGLLLADEPTSQLDSQHRATVLDVLDRISEEFGTTIVVVSHDPDVAGRLGRTITMRDGRVGAEGRRGENFAVVGVDGSLHLPDQISSAWPAGTLVRFTEEGDDLRLGRVVDADSAPDQPEGGPV